MSRITIHLDNFTAAKLNEWRGEVDAGDAIKVMIYLSRRDPYIRGQVSKRLSLHPAGPEAAMSRITIDLDNQTDLDLKQWGDQGDAAAAIQAMIYVTRHDHYISSKVMGRLADQRVPGITVRNAGPVPDRTLPPQPPQPAPRPPTVPATQQKPAPGSLGRAPSPGAPRAPRGPSPF